MIVAAYRVKNEGMWLAESLMRSLSIADCAIVLDDHSTDETISVASMFPDVEVIPSPFEGFDEARDRNFVLSRCIEAGAKWILTLDGDEVLTPSAIREIRKFPEGGGGLLRLRIAYLWDSPTRERCDGVYSCFIQNIFWSVFDQPQLQRGLFFKRGFTGRSHCGRKPMNLEPARTVLGHSTVKHYGYIYESQRISKYEIKTARDPLGDAAEQYGHIVLKPTRHAPGPPAFRNYSDN